MSQKARPRQKPISKKHIAALPQPMPGWRRLLLTLALVPLILGVLLIFAWAIDWDLWGGLDNQIVIGALFLLFSFFWMNAAQGNWPLAIGWLLLTIADYMVLSLRVEWSQRIGAVLGLAGILIVGYEYFSRIAKNRARR